MNDTRRTVLITGASRNLGRAAALEFASRGYNVVVHARADRDAAARVVDECRELGGDATPVLGDLSDPEAVEDIVTAGRDAFGGIDIYLANAAVRPRQSLLEISYEDWNRVLATNLSSAFYLAKNLVPGMVERGWGRVLHTSGGDGFAGAPFRAHNVTAKAGVHGLTKAMALELAGSGVTVNSIVPGHFNTTRDPVNYPAWDPVAKSAEIPVGRLGEPEEYGRLCAFIGSEDAGFITGQAFHINGGMVLM